jgi:hypothetical protein
MSMNELQHAQQQKSKYRNRNTDTNSGVGVIARLYAGKQPNMRKLQALSAGVSK